MADPPTSMPQTKPDAPGWKKPTGMMAAPAGQATMGEMSKGPPPGMVKGPAPGYAGGFPAPTQTMQTAMGTPVGKAMAAGFNQGPMVSAPPQPTPPPAPLVNKGYGALPPMPNAFESGPYASAAGTQWEQRARAMSAGRPGVTPPGAMGGFARPGMASRGMGGRMRGT